MEQSLGGLLADLEAERPGRASVIRESITASNVIGAESLRRDRTEKELEAVRKLFLAQQASRHLFEASLNNEHLGCLRAKAALDHELGAGERREGTLQLELVAAKKGGPREDVLSRSSHGTYVRIRSSCAPHTSLTCRAV